jgi:hypothetical protein
MTAILSIPFRVVAEILEQREVKKELTRCLAGGTGAFYLPVGRKVNE